MPKIHFFSRAGKLLKTEVLPPVYPEDRDPVTKLEARIAALEGKRPSVSPAVDIINKAASQK